MHLSAATPVSLAQPGTVLLLSTLLYIPSGAHLFGALDAHSHFIQTGLSTQPLRGRDVQACCYNCLRSKILFATCKTKKLACLLFALPMGLYWAF